MSETKKFIEPMIFNDKESDNSYQLKKGMDFDVKDKSIEEKLYIILYRLEEDNVESYQNNCFSICIGRTNTYNDIKEKLISGLNINIHRSKIITETKQTESKTGDRKYYLLPYDECISIYSFCISVSEYYSNDDFNIEEFNVHDIPENDDIEKLPGYLTAEQLEYRKLLDESFERDKFINELKRKNGINI